MNQRCCSCLSRRNFLSRAGKAALGLGLGLEGLASAQNLTLGAGPVIRAAFLRPPGKYWLGWPGTSYDVEGHRQEYTALLQQSATDLGLQAVPNAEPLYDPDAVARFAKQITDTRPDGVVVTLLHIGCWGWLDPLTKTGVPLIVFSPIGTSFTGHLAGISRQNGVYVTSTIDFEGVRWGLRMVRTARDLANSRILRIAGGESEESVLDHLGTTIRTVPRRTFSDLFDQTAVTSDVKDLAADYFGRAEKVVEPSHNDGLNAAKTYFVARKLLADEGANALAMDCLGMVADRVVPTPPCMAWSKLNDEGGTTACCEADLLGCVSLMFVDRLLGRPGFLQDPVAETLHNTFIGAHCSCPTRLHGFGTAPEPFILRSHSESDIGVSMQVLWPEGQRVTFVRFNSPTELIVDAGTVVGNIDTPPAGGCRTSVELTMDRVPDARDVKGFHQVLLYGDYVRQVRDFCQLYGVNVVQS